MKHGKKIMGGLGCLIPILLFLNIFLPGGLFGFLIEEGTYFHYFDRQNKMLWEKYLERGNWLGHSPVFLPDSSVVLNSKLDGLTCIDPDGSVRWSYNPVEPDYSMPSPYIAKGLLLCQYSGETGAELHAVKETGELAWVYTLGEWAADRLGSYENICVSGDLVFIRGKEKLHCIDLMGQGETVFEWTQIKDRSILGNRLYNKQIRELRIVPGAPDKVLYWDNQSIFSVGQTGVEWSYTPPQIVDEEIEYFSIAVTDQNIIVAYQTLKQAKEEHSTTLIQLDHDGVEVSITKIPGTQKVLKDLVDGAPLLLSSYPNSRRSQVNQLSRIDSHGEVCQIDPPKGASVTLTYFGFTNEIQEQFEMATNLLLFSWEGQPIVVHPGWLSIEQIPEEIAQSKAGLQATKKGEFPSFYLKSIRRQLKVKSSYKVKHESAHLSPRTYFAPNGNLLVKATFERSHR